MKIRFLPIALIALAVCAISGAAGADNDLRGAHWLRAKNSAEGTVLLGQKVYHVGATTQIRGLKGEQLRLADLVWVPEVESFSPPPRVPTLWVEYDATLVGTQLRLNWIQLSLDQEGLDQTQLPPGVDSYGRLLGTR